MRVYFSLLFWSCHFPFQTVNDLIVINLIGARWFLIEAPKILNILQEKRNTFFEHKSVLLSS